MDLTPSAEQRALADLARTLVTRRRSVLELTKLGSSEVGYDPELWRDLAALDWAALMVPEDHGGVGQGMVELATLCEELGRGPLPSPLVVSTTLVALPIVWAGSPAQRQRWLPRMASGEIVGTLAVLEPGMRDEWSEAGMDGRPPLRGTKILVPWAAAADLILVATASGLWLVERDEGGVTWERHASSTGEPLFAVGFDGPTMEPLGTSATARELLTRALDHASVAQLASAIGSADRALEMTIEHARNREQFGRPIGAFQAVAHRCADMRSELDACRVLAYQAAWALDRGQAEIEVPASLAYAKEALRRLSVHAHQVHGALGFSTEYGLHLLTRRIKAFELTYGAPSRHRERLALAMGLGGRSSVPR
ncbi:MAG: acyl-CoA dehydrogenase family protein [Acidimicrobiales bacterium]